MLPVQGTQIWSLVGELRFHMPLGQKKIFFYRKRNFHVKYTESCQIYEQFMKWTLKNQFPFVPNPKKVGFFPMVILNLSKAVGKWVLYNADEPSHLTHFGKQFGNKYQEILWYFFLAFVSLLKKGVVR